MPNKSSKKDNPVRQNSYTDTAGTLNDVSESIDAITEQLEPFSKMEDAVAL